MPNPKTIFEALPTVEGAKSTPEGGWVFGADTCAVKAPSAENELVSACLCRNQSGQPEIKFAIKAAVVDGKTVEFPVLKSSGVLFDVSKCQQDILANPLMAKDAALARKIAVALTQAYAALLCKIIDDPIVAFN